MPKSSSISRVERRIASPKDDRIRPGLSPRRFSFAIVSRLPEKQVGGKKSQRKVAVWTLEQLLTEAAKA
jgi:hypothetical protein